MNDSYLPQPQVATTSYNGASTSQALQQAGSAAAQKAQQVGQNIMGVYFSHLGFLEFVGLVLSLGIFALVIYFAIESGWWGARVDRFRDVILRSNISKKKAQDAWTIIQGHFYRGSDNDLKVAILEADKLLNDALREAGVMGIQLGDRLKRATESQIPNLNDLWQAHKLRNQIAHEPNFRLKRDLAERALDIYEITLRNLGVFDGQEQ